MSLRKLPRSSIYELRRAPYAFHPVPIGVPTPPSTDGVQLGLSKGRGPSAATSCSARPGFDSFSLHYKFSRAFYTFQADLFDLKIYL